MPRFIAFHTMPDVNIEKLNAALKEVKNWRPTPSTTVLKVYCASKNGKLVSECEAAKQDDFEAWLKSKGWSWDAIYQVDAVAQTGNIWKV